MAMLRQCELHHENWVTVTWLPDRVARVGCIVNLRGDSRPWIVAEAYERVDERLLKKREICCWSGGLL